MSRPNILLLLFDQWRYDTLGANGGKPVRTPRLDRFAAEGVRCTRAYTPVSICSSARASLLTGLYPHSHGMLNNCHEDDAILPDLPAEMPTFSRALRDSGYATGYIGKWHAGRTRGPETQGFNSASGTIQAYTRYRVEQGLPAEPEAGDDAVYADIGRLRMLLSAADRTPVEQSYSAYLVDESLRTLDALSRRDEPFFVQVSFEGPHHPYLIPEPYASMYDPDSIEPWASFADTFEGKPAIHQIQMRHRGVENWTWEQWAPVVAKYFGFVSHLDEQVGRLLDYLYDRGLADETLVVVSADHGDFAGGHRQFNKGPLMYEDIYHVPLLARWPAGGIAAGSTCDRFIRLLDLGPTLLEAGQTPLDWVAHGRSALPLWQGDTVDDWPASVFTEYHGDEWGLYSQRMVRGERYKLVYNAQDRSELYDLENDPAELTNLAEHPGYGNIRRQLELELRDWMARTDDPLRQWSGYLLGLD